MDAQTPPPSRRLPTVEQWKQKICDPCSYGKSERRSLSLKGQRLSSSLVSSCLQLVEDELKELKLIEAFSPLAWQSLQREVGQQVLYPWLRPCLQAISGETEEREFLRYERLLLVDQVLLVSFLQRFQGLCHVWALFIHEWALYLQHFVQALSADSSKLAHLFDWEHIPQYVRKVELSSDHGIDRMVWMLTFTEGQQVVYKPRDLAMDRAYAQWIQQLNALNRGSQPELKSCRLLERPSYGWMEDVQVRPLQQESELRPFFWRCGMLLAQTQLLLSQRLHYGNIVAWGEHPLLIDAETLLSPHPLEGGYAEPLERSLLLPIYGSDSLRMGYGSGIGIDSDRCPMDYLNAMGEESSHNLPRLHGRFVGANEYVQEVLEGFEGFSQALRVWMEREGVEALLRPFEEVFFRADIRSSQTYISIWKACQRADCLESEESLRRRIQELLASAPLDTQSPQGKEAALQEYELEALMAMRFPLLETKLDSCDLYADRQLLCPRYFEQSAEHLLKEHMETALSPERLTFLKAHVGTQLLPTRLLPPAELSVLQPKQELSAEPGDPRSEDFLMKAEELGERLQARSAGSSGELIVGGHHRLPLNAYFGLSGIALFFAELAEATQKACWREQVELLTSHIHARCAEAQFFSQAGSFSEGIRGRGGLIFSLRAIHQRFPESCALECAQALAQSWLRLDPAKRREESLLCGEEGTLLSLLDLDGVAWRDRAQLNMKELMRRLPEKELQLQHREGGALESVSFLWGSSGLAYLLYRLGEALGDSKALTQGKETLLRLTDLSLEWMKEDPVLAELAASYSYAEGLAGMCLAAADTGIDGPPAAFAELQQDLSQVSRVDLHTGKLAILHTQWKMADAVGDTGLKAGVRTQVRQQLLDVDLSDFDHPGFMKGLAGLGYLLIEVSERQSLTYPDPLLMRLNSSRYKK